jgi:hypothetical protein
MTGLEPLIHTFVKPPARPAPGITAHSIIAVRDAGPPANGSDGVVRGCVASELSSRL